MSPSLREITGRQASTFDLAHVGPSLFCGSSWGSGRWTILEHEPINSSASSHTVNSAGLPRLMGPMTSGPLFRELNRRRNKMNAFVR